VIIFGLRFALFTHISGTKTHSFKICALKRNDFRQLKKFEVVVDVNNNLPAHHSKFPNKFHTKWKSYYSWLRYDEDKDFMYYVASCDGKKRNGMVKMAQNRNLRRSTLERHSSLPDHKAAIQAPSLQKNPLFSNMCTFLSHCFETKNYHCLRLIDNKKRSNATKPGFQRFNQVLMWQE